MRSTELLARMRLDASHFDRSLKQSQAELQGFSRVAGALSGKNLFSGLATDAANLAPALSSVPLAIAAVGAALTGAGLAARRAGVEFEAALARITTLGPDATQNLDRTRDAILDTFATTPVNESVKGLAEASFLLQSSGRTAAQALEDLPIAARAAAAAVVSVTEAVDGLTTVTNAWRESQISTQTASDVLFETTNLGKATFQDLANKIGLVAPIAAAAGVRFQEVAAAVAVLSNQGVPASSAFEGLRSAIINIQKPTETFKKEYSALAEAFGASRLARDGIIKFLQDFERESKGSSIALGALFSDTTALSTAQGLLVNNGRDAAAALTQLDNAAGAADRAFVKINGTAAAQQLLIRNQLIGVWTNFGSLLNTVTLPILGAVARMINDISDNATFASADVQKLLDNSQQFAAKNLNQIVDQYTDNRSQFLKGLSGEQVSGLIERLKQLRDLQADNPNLLRNVGIPIDFIPALEGEAGRRREVQRSSEKTDGLATEKAQQRVADREADEAAERRRVARKASATQAAAEAKARDRDREQAAKATVTEFEQLMAQLDAKAIEATQDAAGALQAAMEKVLSEGSSLLAMGVLGPEAARLLEQRLATFERLQSQMIAAEEAAKATEVAITNATSKERGVPTATTRILDVREQELRAILAGTANLAARKKIEEQLAAVAAARVDKSEEQGNTGNLRFTPKGELDTRIAQMGDLAQAIATVGDQLGVLPRRAVDALRGIGALAEQGAQLRKAFGAGGAVGTLGKLSIGIGVAAGIASLASSLFTESPEDKQRKADLKANTDAIKRLTARVGDLSQSSLSGTTLSKIRDVFAPERFGGFRVDGQGRVGDVASLIAQRSGATIADVRAYAETLGITLSDTIESLFAFREASRQADLKGYIDTFAGSLQRLDDTLRADGVTDAFEIFRRRVAVLTDAKTGFPALATAIDGLDLDTVEGRTEAQSRARSLFDDVANGRLPLEQLGGLSGSEARQALLDFITGARELNTGGTTGTGGFNETRSITEVTGSRLAGLLSSGNLYLSKIAADVAALRDTFVLGPTPRLSVPSIDGLTGIVSGGAGLQFAPGSIVINLTLTRDVLGADPVTAVAMGERLGQSIGESLVATIDQGLRTRQLRQRLLTGDPRLTS